MTGPPSVEQAFALIEQGNQAANDTDLDQLWQASDSYCQASELLQQLSSNTTQGDEHAQKIATLYQNQSNEYRGKAQDCFIRALQHLGSTNVDEDDLDDAEAMSRIDLFAHLFSKPKLLEHALANAGPQVDDDATLDDISQRLAALNDAIPKGMPASNKDISKQNASAEDSLNAGLQRLGLKPIASTAKKPTNPFPLVDSNQRKSEVEQVEDLIHKVHEHVQVEDGGTTAAAASTISLDDDQDAELTPEDIVRQAKEEAALMMTTTEVLGDSNRSNTRLLEDNHESTRSLLQHMMFDSDDDIIMDDDEDDDDDDNEDDALDAAQRTIIATQCVDVQAVLAELIALVQQEDDETVIVDRGVATTAVTKARMMLQKAERKLKLASKK